MGETYLSARTSVRSDYYTNYLHNHPSYASLNSSISGLEVVKKNIDKLEKTFSGSSGSTIARILNDINSLRLSVNGYSEYLSKIKKMLESNAETFDSVLKNYLALEHKKKSSDKKLKNKNYYGTIGYEFNGRKYFDCSVCKYDVKDETYGYVGIDATGHIFIEVMVEEYVRTEVTNVWGGVYSGSNSHPKRSYYNYKVSFF